MKRRTTSEQPYSADRKSGASRRRVWAIGSGALLMVLGAGMSGQDSGPDNRHVSTITREVPPPPELEEPTIEPRDSEEVRPLTDEERQAIAFEQSPIHEVPFSAPVHIWIHSETAGDSDKKIGVFDGEYIGLDENGNPQYSNVPPQDPYSAHVWQQKQPELGVSRDDLRLTSDEDGDYKVEYAPRTGGQMEIAGHATSTLDPGGEDRDEEGGKSFQYLYKVEVGDEVVFQLANGAYMYYEVVEYDDSVLRNDPESAANNENLNSNDAGSVLVIACYPNYDTGAASHLIILKLQLIATEMPE